MFPISQAITHRSAPLPATCCVAAALQLDESISTCRFAMRVALVRNAVVLNEEVDPTAVIRRLRQVRQHAVACL